MEQIKKNKLVMIVAATLIVLAVGYLVLRGNKKSAPPKVLEVPQVEIQNNPVEKKIPEINPVQKANPFQYQNPLLK